jgi:hypothetical protein
VAQNQGNGTCGLQRRERLADASLSLVDLIEEQDTRNALVLKRFDDDLEGGNLLLVGLATTTAKSTPASAPSASKANSIEPGQSRKVMVSPMKSVSAILTSTLIWWARASGEASPIVFPSPIVPCRLIAPVRANIASSRVVLPLANGPTSAMHLGPATLSLPSAMTVPPAVPCRSYMEQHGAFRAAPFFIVSGIGPADKGCHEG